MPCSLWLWALFAALLLYVVVPPVVVDVVDAGDVADADRDAADEDAEDEDDEDDEDDEEDEEDEDALDEESADNRNRHARRAATRRRLERLARLMNPRALRTRSGRPHRLATRGFRALRHLHGAAPDAKDCTILQFMTAFDTTHLHLLLANSA